jgi:Flp pilus assembly pilin Flp
MSQTNKNLLCWQPPSGRDRQAGATLAEYALLAALIAALAVFAVASTGRQVVQNWSDIAVSLEEASR